MWLHLPFSWWNIYCVAVVHVQAYNIRTSLIRVDRKKVCMESTAHVGAFYKSFPALSFADLTLISFETALTTVSSSWLFWFCTSVPMSMAMLRRFPASGAILFHFTDCTGIMMLVLFVYCASRLDCRQMLPMQFALCFYFLTSDADATRKGSYWIVSNALCEYWIPIMVLTSCMFSSISSSLPSCVILSSWYTLDSRLQHYI